MLSQANISQGVQNLLFNCAELEAGDKLLLVLERARFGWYKEEVVKAVVKTASLFGIIPKILEVNAPENQSLEEVESIISEYDCTIFFARIGDQNRFEKHKIKAKRVMCYARSVEALGSLFGTINHKAMLELKETINSLFLNSKNIEVKCPLGTNLSGKMLNSSYYTFRDVTVYRFPMLVPMPILASSFSGNVIISKYLTSTGSQAYQPNSLKLSNLLTVKILKGRIDEVVGSNNDVKNFKKHYEFVSKKFGLDKENVHSWHAGIHPGTKHDKSIDLNPDQWSNTIFGSPRYLHFHTCGIVPPGEICWMIQDPTIKLDSKVLWNKGALILKQFEATRQCLKKWPELNQLFR